MTRSTLAGILALAIAGGSLFADGGEVRDKAAELVRQLSSDDPSVRERATEDLWKLGPDAAPILEEATKSSDPEVVWRAEKALAKIRGTALEPKETQSERPSPRQRSRGSSSSVQIRVMGPGSYSLSQDGTGHIALTVTERDANGKRQVYTYEANSTLEFKEKYPEIAKRYGIGEDVGSAPQAAGPPAPVPQEAQNPSSESTPPADFGAEVSAIDSTTRDPLDLSEEGVVVVMVVPGSGAEEAGLEQNDVILTMNHEPVRTRKGFRRLLIECTAARQLELEIVRDGERRTVSVHPSLLGR